MVWLGSSLYVTGAAKAEAANSERAVASAMRFMGVLRMWCVLQRWNTRLRLLDSRGFVEAQPRRTREDAGRVALDERSDARRGRKESVSACSFRRWTVHENKKTIRHHKKVMRRK